MAKVSDFSLSHSKTFSQIANLISCSPLPRAVAGYPPAWTFKPDPAIEALRMREAEEKERERKRREEEAAARREREEKERKEKEERARKEQQEREQREQRERERERERREKERRELERMERERMLEQQRMSQTKNMQRERSPLRNGTDSDGTRIKEEQREPKRETVDEMMMRGPPNVVPDPRYAAAHAQHLAAAHYMAGRHMMPGQLPPVSIRPTIFGFSSFEIGSLNDFSYIYFSWDAVY